MSKYFKETSDSEEIMQGDIIRAKSQDFSTQDHLGVIITADCDIFQKKSNDTLTYLKILHLEDYVNEAWAIKQQKKMREKQENPICEQINAKLRKSGKDLSPITHESLKEWLKHHEPEKITEKICEHDGHNKEEILEKLKGYKLLTIEEDFNLKKLQEAWDLFKVKERKQKEELRKISSSGAFEDFFFLPELPSSQEFGFVVMLRSIHNLHAEDLFLSEQDARINNKPFAYYRTGRLDDGLRFAITQKLAFLFSRIGMPTNFEDSCETALEIFIEDKYSTKD